MADAGALPAPLAVEYDRVTGVPAEFNDFLPPDCAEFKALKAAAEKAAAGVEGALEGLAVGDGAKPPAEEIEKKLPGGKVKKKSKLEIVIERNVRNKKKCITTVSGLDLFKVKLNEASKLFGKKFASGASVTKNASGKEQIDIQGDCQDKLPDFILKTYGKDHGIEKSHLFYMEGKSKTAFFSGAYK